MGTWTNSDGLRIKFGTTEAAVGIGGWQVTYGAFREVEIVFDLADLTQTETILSYDVVIPQDTVIGKVTVIADTAAATGTAIDVGLIRTSDGTTEVDYNGILAAFPTASMDAEGETTVLTDGSTYAGVLVGVVASATYPTYISASMTDSTSFTAGRVRLRLHLYSKSSTT